MSIEQTNINITKNEDDSIGQVRITYIIKEDGKPDGISALAIDGSFFDETGLEPNDFSNRLEPILRQFILNFNLRLPE